MCVRIFQSFQFQVAYRMKNDMCVYDCVCACVCVCSWQMVAHIYLIALAAKGLKLVFSEVHFEGHLHSNSHNFLKNGQIFKRFSLFCGGKICLLYDMKK